MALSVFEIAELASDVAHESATPVAVMGALPSGDSSYTEVFLTLEDCASEPCRLTLGVFRDAPRAEVKCDLRRQLERQLDRRSQRLARRNRIGRD
jgi:hypothetical protein